MASTRLFSPSILAQVEGSGVRGELGVGSWELGLIVNIGGLDLNFNPKSKIQDPRVAYAILTYPFAQFAE
jgi:hypothetical protein